MFLIIIKQSVLKIWNVKFLTRQKIDNQIFREDHCFMNVFLLTFFKRCGDPQKVSPAGKATFSF